MNKLLILVVEDDPSIRKLITTTLKAHEYRYLSAANGQSAILEASSHNPDIVLLDLGLPDMDGVEIIRKIRAWSNMPIIVISARSEDSDKIEALDAGADDYLTKPFAAPELLARIRAMTRTQMTQNTSSLSFGNLSLNQTSFELSSPSASYQLTNKEFQLLELLMANPGQVISSDRLFEKIWGYESDADPSVIWVYISYLRKKLTALNASVRIRAIRNAGYRLEEIQ